MIEIAGKVVQGKKYGRILGFPTANLDRREYVRKKMNVKLGIWAGHAEIKNSNRLAGRQELEIKIYPAAIVIGPIDSKGLPKIEAHLVAFKGDLYGKKLTIKLEKFIRPFKKYKNIEELKNQIAKDIETVKKLKF